MTCYLEKQLVTEVYILKLAYLLCLISIVSIIHYLFQEASKECGSVYVKLNRPEFLDATLPVNWLSHLGGNLVELAIVGGNLRHIPADAFTATCFYNLETLLLEDVAITTWHPKLLQGLLRLEKLIIKDCKIGRIHRNALNPFNDTLRHLVIQNSHYFNPENLTGSSDLTKLTDVNFSFNDFYGVLNVNSFSKLTSCKELSLTSSRITVIQEGTFDALESIEFINLNKNRLTTLSPQIFERIVRLRTGRITINLQDNKWNCTCEIEPLRELHQEGIVIMDPMCFSPKHLHGTTFSKVETFCNESTDVIDRIQSNFERRSKNSITVYTNRDCFTDTTLNTSILQYTSVSYYNCSNGRMRYLDSDALESITRNSRRFSTQLQPLYYLQDDNYSLVEIRLNSSNHCGLIWFQSSCPEEVYCIEKSPTQLRLYNVGTSDSYTLCTTHRSGLVNEDSCITFNPSTDLSIPTTMAKRRIYFLVGSIFGAGLIGAIFIYGLILKNPALLKGNKRILILKHTFADALVLPPNVLQRCDNIQGLPSKLNMMESNMLVVPRRPDMLTPPVLSRSNSTRSSKSGTPSYVSAIQPSDDQLMEWRLRQHFQPSPILSPMVATPDQISWIYECDPLYYSSSVSSENACERK